MDEHAIISFRMQLVLVEKNEWRWKGTVKIRNRDPEVVGLCKYLIYSMLIGRRMAFQVINLRLVE